MARDKDFFPGEIIQGPVFHPRRRPIVEKCAWPLDCPSLGNCARGFCAKHFLEFRAACIANGSWGHKEDREEFLRLFLHPQPTPWEYENPEGEAELIALAEAQERIYQEREKQERAESSANPAEKD
jgi:hypothetical protein